MKEQEPKDKRTKHWKVWKADFDKVNKVGLGDVIEKGLEVTGIAKVVKKVFGDDCGCSERKALLNKIIKFPVVRCFTEDLYNKWTDFRNRENKKVNKCYLYF